MEHNIGNNVDDEEDEAALVDAFFLPGGILDPEDETDLGYKGEISYEDNLPFLLPSLPSPVSLNPWETPQADNTSKERKVVDSDTSWAGHDESPSNSLLSEISMPALSSPNHLVNSIPSFLPSNNISPPSTVVPPPGFYPSISQDYKSSSIGDDTNKKSVVNAVDQVKTGNCTSFADVIRSPPPASFTTPERKSNHKQTNYRISSQIKEKTFKNEAPKRLATSTSPDKRNISDSSARKKSRNRSNPASKQNGKATSSTEWNSVDRNSFTRVASRMDSNSDIPPLQQGRRVVEHPHSDEADSSTSESSSDASIDLPVKNNIATKAQIPETVDHIEEEGKELLRIRQTEPQFKPVDRIESLDQISTTSSSEPSNTCAKSSIAAQNESISNEILAVVTPLLGQLVLSTSNVVFIIWKTLQLVSASVQNILLYATLESCRKDGALLCYMVLYITPTICDWMMVSVSLPHFSPHIISTISLYFLSGFPDKTATLHSSTISGQLCRFLLRTFRVYLPLTMLLEGFRGPNSMIMTLDISTRLILAYLLSMLRAGLLFSPVGWLGWSLQVIISLWLPEGLILSCILSLMGLALIRLTSIIPAQRAASIHRI